MPILLFLLAAGGIAFVMSKKGTATTVAPSVTMCTGLDAGIDAATCTKVWTAYASETNIQNLKNLYMQVFPKFPLAATLLTKKIAFLQCGVSPSTDPHVFPYDPAYAYASSKLAYGPGIYGLDASITQAQADSVRNSMLMTQAQVDALNVPGLTLTAYMAQMVANFRGTATPAGQPVMHLPVAAEVLNTRYLWLTSKCAVAGAPTPGGSLSSGTWEVVGALDDHLSPVTKHVVAHNILTNRDPNQLNALGKMMGANAPLAKYALDNRAWQLRQGL